MKKILKPFVFICCGFFFLFGLERISHKATDGFVISKIQYRPMAKEKWTVELTPEEETVLSQILSQPFYYKDSGSQFYVFESEDGQYVLKFFKFQHMSIRPIFHYLPMFGKMKQWREKKILKKNQLIEFTFDSIKTAFDYLKKETGLLFIHLNAEQQPKGWNVKIYDKLHIAHQLSLDNISFIMQKKASLVYPTIDQWMKNKEIEKAKKGIRDVLHIPLNRCRKGIGDIDPDFATNFGFLNERPLQIDIGRFYKDPSRKKPQEYRNEMVRITRNFRKWLAENHPELIADFDKEIENME